MIEKFQNCADRWCNGRCRFPQTPPDPHIPVPARCTQERRWHWHPVLLILSPPHPPHHDHPHYHHHHHYHHPPPLPPHWKLVLGLGWLPLTNITESSKEIYLLLDLILCNFFWRTSCFWSGVESLCSVVDSISTLMNNALDSEVIPGSVDIFSCQDKHRKNCKCCPGHSLPVTH